MPVSWQMAPSVSTARSMFCAMIVSACDARVPAGSASSAVFIAARTSGGRSVEVRTISWRTLSKNEGSMASVYCTGDGIGSGASNQSESDPMTMRPHRTRSARRAGRPRRRVLRRADGHGRSRTSPSAACARPPTSSRRPSSSRRRRPRRTRRSAGWTPTIAQAPSSPAADEILAGRAARSVRGRRLPGRRRHLAQHECERGAGQPRGRAPGRGRAAPTGACTRTITSTWASRPTTSFRRRRGSPCSSARARWSSGARALADSLGRQERGSSPA